MVLASMGQTLQSLSNERFVLGLGRSAEWRWRNYGQPSPTLASMGDTADILRRGRPFSRNASRIEGVVLGRAGRIQCDVVPPVISEVIRIREFCAGGREQPVQRYGLFVEDSAVWMRCVWKSVHLIGQGELVRMSAIPVEDDLEDRA